MFKVLLFLLLHLLHGTFPNTRTAAEVLRESDVKYVEPHEIPAYNAFNEGVSLEGSDPVQALAQYKLALQLKPDLEEALLNIGSLHSRLNDDESALISFRTLLSLPSSSHTMKASACNNIGHMKHRKAGKDVLNLRSTVEWYRKALSFEPTHMDSMYNLGKVYQEIGEVELAKQAYEKVLQFYPDHAQARLNLSNYYFSAKEYEKAAFYQHQVIESPSAPLETKLMALNNLGNLYRDSNLHDLAEDAFRRGFEMSGNSSATALVNLIVARRTLNKWEGLEGTAENIVQLCEKEMARRRSLRALNNGQTSVEKQKLDTAPPLLPYDSLLLSAATPSFRKLVAIATSEPYIDMLRFGKFSQVWAPGNKITLCYLSYDFRDHPMGHLTRALVTGHSKSIFKTTLGSYGINDKSRHRRSFEADVDVFIDVANTDANQSKSEPIVNVIGAGKRLHEEDIDIVIDLMSHTRGSILQIAALKPSSILVNYLGFPGTSGAAYYDYAIVDTVVVAPEASSGDWSEKLVFLPHTYQSNEYNFSASICVDKSSQVCQRGRGLLLRQNAERESAISLCNFNNVDKIEPSAFTVWMNALLANPFSKMFLLRPKDPAGSIIVDNLLLEAMARGVIPDRVVFLPRADHKDHMERIGGCDIFLDTLVYGAHTTASDFLWAGVPLFTVNGYGPQGSEGGISGGMASRVGSSFLSNLLGHGGESSVKSLERHVNLFTSSEGGRTKLQELRHDLAKSLLAKPHFDHKLISDNIEEAYKIMLQLREGNNVTTNHHIVVRPQTKSFNSQYLYDMALQAAVDALTAEDYGAALRVTERLAYAFGDESSDVNHLRGLAFQRFDLQAAIRHVRRAIEIDPETSFYRSNLASLLSSAGKNKEALAEYAVILKLDFVGQMIQGTGGLMLSLPGCSDEAYNIVCGADTLIREFCDVAAQEDDDLEVIRNVSEVHPELAVAIADFLSRRAQQIMRSDAELTYRLLKVAFHLNQRDGLVQIKLGAAAEAAGRGDRAFLDYFSGVRKMYRSENVKARNKLNFKALVGGHRPVVAIYCNEYGQTWWKNWSYSSAKRGGLGGSEESVLFISRELARLGYTIVIYNEVLDEEAGVDPENENVFWTHWKNYDVADPPDVFIAWRYHLSLALAGVGDTDGNFTAGLRPKKTFLWLQDAVPTASYTDAMCSEIDAIFVLSEFHSRILPSYCPFKVTPNGIDVEKYFTEGGSGDGPNDSAVMAYGSAPNRGLEILLEMWEEIFQSLQGVGISPQLNIYYGFSKSFMDFGRSGKLGSGFDAWVSTLKNRIEVLPGVNYVGMVSHENLTKEYAKAGFILYPTTYPETGCVTLMKAMSAGAIPITSRYESSTLPELTGSFDLGPREALRSDMSSTELMIWKRKYIQSVIDHVQQNLQGFRAEMKTRSRERFAWKHVAKLWSETFAE